MCPFSINYLFILLILVAVIFYVSQTEIKNSPQGQIDSPKEQINLHGLSLIEQAKTWCAGKHWWWRLLLLVWFGFIFSGLLKNPNNANIFGPLNLGIHEMGHLIFAWSGQFLQIAGGTIVQLAAPIYGMWNFYRIKDFFSMALCFGWLATNLFNVSNYMADAHLMQLDLVTVGDRSAIIHDWNYLFGRMGVLPYNQLIAGFVWLLAVLSMLVCFAAGTWLLWLMICPKVKNH